MNAVVQPPTPETPPVSQIKVPGPKVLLMGDTGTGKSHSIQTLIKAGIMPFVLATEQNCIQALKGLPDGSWHYKYIAPQPANSFDNVFKMLDNVNKMSYENLTKTVDPLRHANNKLLDVVTLLKGFKCDCHNKDWGGVEQWNTDRALVIDGLSGLSDMAMALVVGNKPVRSMPDWGVAQQAVRLILNPATTALKCMFILIAHMDREKDEITGGTSITVKTLGQKLGPDLPRMFSDVIRARREVDKFHWDTADSQAVVVARNIPIASKLEASFVPLIANWIKDGGKIEATIQEKM